MPEPLAPLQVALMCFTLAALAGLTQLLRSGKPLTLRLVASTCLYTGLVGLVVMLSAYQFLDKYWPYILCISLLAGLSGTGILDFIVDAWSRGGITIIVRSKTEDKDVDRNP